MDEEAKTEEQRDETRENTVLRDEKGHFLPGTPSLNPKGRPKGSFSITGMIKAKLKECPPDRQETYADLLIARILNDAIIQGNDKLVKQIWNYIDGMPKQKLTIDTEQHQQVEETLDKVQGLMKKPDEPQTDTDVLQGGGETTGDSA